MKRVDIILAGAGQRGRVYSEYVRKHPEEARIVAVCEPDEVRRRHYAETYKVPEDMCFSDWKKAAERPKFADAVFICTQDRDHRDAAVAFAGRGYHIMLEKPMAPDLESCMDIYRAAKDNGIILAVCHVLRYAKHYRKIREMINDGVIGKVRALQLLEPVGYWHQAHSFVRGNWRNEAESSFMLLAKSCHDLDLINYLVPDRCSRVASFGNLSYFNKENRPEGAADRCTDCPSRVESLCPYSAYKIYLRDRRNFYSGWPVSVLTDDATVAGVSKAIEEGPYGRCVFACDNDVVDNQVVSLEFESGATASFTMCAFNKSAGRELLIMGDQGSIRCADNGITHSDFLSDKTEPVSLDDGEAMVSGGHGGGDPLLEASFIAAVRDNDPSLVLTGPEESLVSHLMVFAAERSRREGAIIDVPRPEC